MRRSIAPTLREHPAVIYGLVALALLISLAIGPVDGNCLVPLLALFGFACLGGPKRFAARQQASSCHAAMARRQLPLFSQSDRAKKALARATRPVNLLAYARLSSPATASADPSVVIQSGKSIGCL